MNYLLEQINQWGLDRGIIQNGNPTTQAIKTLEEVHELLRAVDRDDLDETKDAIGDIVVTLIMICGQLDITLPECIKGAYEEIKDRKGHLNHKGDFIKEIKEIE